MNQEEAQDKDQGKEDLKRKKEDNQERRAKPRIRVVDTVFLENFFVCPLPATGGCDKNVVIMILQFRRVF